MRLSIKESIADIREGDWSDPKAVDRLAQIVETLSEQINENARVINQHAKTINRLAAKLAAKQEPSPNSIFDMVFGSR